jgi:hypothetical protein
MSDRKLGKEMSMTHQDKNFTFFNGSYQKLGSMRSRSSGCYQNACLYLSLQVLKSGVPLPHAHQRQR